MSAAFREIQNVLRTYQRQLRLPDAPARQPAETREQDDRVTISPEARTLGEDSSDPSPAPLERTGRPRR